MGGTKTVITNNPVVCHKFHCQISAQKINSGEVCRVLHIYEKANDVCSIISFVGKLSTKKAHAYEAATKQ